MMRVLTPEQMRAADTAAIAKVGADALMRAAGLRIAETVRSRTPAGRIVAFAGPGNNGGDAFAALAELDSGYDRIVCAESAGAKSEARKAAEARAHAAGVSIRPLPATDADAQSAVYDATLAIDGLFGTGARLPLEQKYHSALRVLDARARSVLAIDIPSGIDALTGAVCEPAVRATVTVTLAAFKPGLLLDPAFERCGEIIVADIGIEPAILDAQPRTFAALDDSTFLALLPQRAANTDKRAAGAPLVIAGSAQFPGAAVLCALGAARSGAGYVTVATAAATAPALRSHLIEQVVVDIDERSSASEAIEALLDVSRHNSAVAIGPGLGLDDRTGEIVRGFAAKCPLPFVADASALFHFAKHLDVLRGKTCVLTPHASEFARLSGKGTLEEGERVARLREFVTRTGVTTLLKGRATLIDDGTTTHINTTGTNALATAGTGDVLTGIIATLLSQGLSPIDAARAGAYWHGLAGRYCERERRTGVIAGDIAEELGYSLPVLRDAPLRDAHFVRSSG